MSRGSQQPLVKLIVCAGAALLLGWSSANGIEAPQKKGVKKKTQGPSVHRAVDSGNCGPELVFDRNSGRMVRKKRFDLVVQKVEMDRSGDAVLVCPTIRNRCPDKIKKGFDVLVEDVVITGSGGNFPGNTSATLQCVWVPDSTSILVRVDYGNKVKNEFSEGNNRCNADLPSGTDSRTHRCR
jgi:hypothetical protein